MAEKEIFIELMKTRTIRIKLFQKLNIQQTINKSLMH